MPVWPFVVVVVLTSVVWPALISDGFDLTPTLDALALNVEVVAPVLQLAVPIGLPLLQLTATIGLVLSERIATRRSTTEELTRRPVQPYIALAVVLSIGSALAIRTLFGLRYFDIYSRVYFSRDRTGIYTIYNFTSYTFFVFTTLITLAGAVFCAVIRAQARPKIPKTVAHQSPTPIGYTTDGRPIYPIVGYTSDGQPITADRAVGMQPTTTRTNSMAIAALIAGWNFFPLGIIFGHIALSQIKRTGEGGRGFAIAGLVLGYLTLAAVAIVAIIIAANL